MRARTIFMGDVVLTVALLCVQASAAEPPPWETGRMAPVWANVKPRRTVRIKHDSRLSDEKNGQALARLIAGLKPGEMLMIGSGRYSLAPKTVIGLKGTAKAPIWIVGADPEKKPVITRPDARQNVLNIGERSRTEYLCLRHLELTGGSTLIRFYDCSHVWLDQCHLHHAGHEGITTNTRDTDHMFITRNHFHDFTNPNATGEAMYLGANHGKCIMSYSVIAGNYVHNCGGRQGDGIELKQGSHNNWIVGNHVHDTNYPCILVYGTNGKGINVVERNICYRSNDNTLQAQGEAIIRNNLLMAAKGAGFSSSDHQGRTTNLVFVHNTVISRRRGANLSSWNGRKGMIFANNMVYTENGDALRFSRGAEGVTMAGNVLVGRVTGAKKGFIKGNGLSDFTAVAWDGTKHDATLKKKSPAIGCADKRFLVERDLANRKRTGPPTAGAYQSRPATQAQPR